MLRTIACVQLVERFTAAPSQAVQLAAEAVASGADAVLAVGGDGTIHEVSCCLLLSHPPMLLGFICSKRG